MIFHKNRVLTKKFYSWRGSPSYGPGPGPYGPEKKNRSKFPLIAPFKGPITLPSVTVCTMSVNRECCFFHHAHARCPFHGQAVVANVMIAQPLSFLSLPSKYMDVTWPYFVHWIAHISGRMHKLCPKRYKLRKNIISC